MAKLIDLLSALFVYFCVATVLTAGVAVIMLTLQGYLTAEKMDHIAAVMHGVPLRIGTPHHNERDDKQIASSLSVNEANQKRWIQSLDLTLREQAVEKGLGRMRALHELVDNANKRYDVKRDAFLKRLKQMKLEAEEDGLVAAGVALETMKPAQQKKMMEKMIEADSGQGLDDAVALIKAMPLDLQRKLHAEFKTDNPQDNESLFEILRQIRKGKPETSFIDDTMDEFAQLGPK